MGCEGVIVGKFAGVVTVCSLVGESKCPLERGKAGGLAASAGFLRVCLADPFARLRRDWRWVVCQTCAEFRATGRSLCCKRAYVGLIEGVECFGEVAQQDAERFLIEYRWVRWACGCFEVRCVAKRTGDDRCGLDEVERGGFSVCVIRWAMSFLMGARRRFWVRTKPPGVSAAVRRTTQPV